MSVTDDDISELINAELLERRTKVMFLRNAGATLQAIAKEVEVSVTTVRKDLALVRRDINNEQPTDVVARHRAVIFDIQRANYPGMMRGDVKAATVILRALHREAALLGLDAPTRILAGVSDVEFSNEAARLIERITTVDPATLKELERVNRASTPPAIIDAEPAPETAPGAPGPHTDAVVAGAGAPAGGVAGDGGSAVHAELPDGGGDTAAVDPGELTDPDDGWSNI